MKNVKYYIDGYHNLYHVPITCIKPEYCLKTVEEYEKEVKKEKEDEIYETEQREKIETCSYDRNYKFSSQVLMKRMHIINSIKLNICDDIILDGISLKDKIKELENEILKLKIKK